MAIFYQKITYFFDSFCSALWNAEHCGHCITAKSPVFGKKLKNRKTNFFTGFQTLLAALFELSCSVITSITAVHSGSKKDHILSKFATLAIFNPTAAIDTQNTTKYRSFRLKLLFKEKTQVDSDAKIYFPKFLNLTLANI